MTIDKEYSNLLISELAQLRTDMRTNFTNLSKEIKDNNNNINYRFDKFSSKHIKSTTFWKVVGTLFLLISGSYAFTSSVFKLLSK